MNAPRLCPIILALAATANAHAFSCAPSESQECLLELSTLTIVFDSGVYNFNGDSQFNGTDGYVTGYTTGAGQFPELAIVDNNGGQRVGFSFLPAMYGQVGGSGFEGYHEASASFTFDALQFIAKPGYRVDAIEFSVSGSRTQVGNGYAALGVPGVPQFTGDQFVATGLYDPINTSFGAGFFVNAFYEQGEDGTAAAYGTASAGFTAASLVVHVSPVPEPSTVVLWIIGAVAMRQRKRSDQSC